jgi:hypothetical protein
MGSDGFAVIPIPAIDPPQRAASPAVPAPLGPGPLEPYAASLGSVDVISALKLDKQLWLILREVTGHSVVGDQRPEISLCRMA